MRTPEPMLSEEIEACCPSQGFWSRLAEPIAKLFSGPKEDEEKWTLAVTLLHRTPLSDTEEETFEMTDLVASLEASETSGPDTEARTG